MLELEGVDEQPDIDDQESTTDSVYIEIHGLTSWFVKAKSQR